MKKKVKKKQNPKRKKIIIAVAVLFLVLIIFFGTNIYLYFQYLLGNDILIRLNVEKENLFLTHGQTENVEIKFSVLGNLFCNIECEYSLEDLSGNVTPTFSNFSSVSGKNFEKNYEFISPSDGSGQNLYRFDVKCKGVKTYFCHTGDQETRKSVLLTLNYDLSESEKQNLQNLTNSLNELLNKSNSIKKIAQELPEKINLTKEKLNYPTKINLISINLTQEIINESIQNISSLWATGNLTRINQEIEYLNKTLLSLENETVLPNNFLENLIQDYNSLVEKINSIEWELLNYSKGKFTQNTSEELNKDIIEFNSLKETAVINKSLDQMNLSLNEFVSEYKLNKIIFESEINSSLEKNYSTSEKLNNITLEKISQVNISFVPYTINLTSPQATCCFKGNCSVCSAGEKDYPIIFLHGHDFSAAVSPEYNLEAFDELQRKLENDSYINAGSLVVSPLEDSIKGVWGKNPIPISVKSSYYFDSVEEKTSLSVFQTKKDNIDTYAVRLNDIIENVKYRTNQEKVVVVTHSMGGLVLRRYIQIFGDESLAQVTLIAAPNHGLDGKILTLCKIFGEQKECEDMDENSLLIKKLTKQTKPNVEVNNIIGVGCDTNGVSGDGIVAESSAYLSWANNLYVNGTCSLNEVSYLHTNIISPKAHPEVYQMLIKILKNQTVI